MCYVHSLFVIPYLYLSRPSFGLHLPSRKKIIIFGDINHSLCYIRALLGTQIATIEIEWFELREMIPSIWEERLLYRLL